MSDLKRELGLPDVYVVCTGAMFSAGFFLLPGIAAKGTGPSVVLAYALGSVFMLPSLLSMAELSTAMPRASGSYFFIDRSMGPLLSTLGGLGTWLALVFESAFALIGIGAYAGLFFDVPIKPVAVGLTLAFGALNVFGAKETTWLQRILVGTLLTIMVLFLVRGFVALTQGEAEVRPGERFTPFFEGGAHGVLHATALIFVAYAGVTKAASVSEEVKNPDRNLPRGMIASLATASVIYVAGVFLLVAFVPAEELRADLTPVATAAERLASWLPGKWPVYLVAGAAVAAFTSTGNAGVLAASRYPMAMANDKILPGFLGKMSRFKTPYFAVIATVAIMSAFELMMSPGSVAEFASATQLLVFVLINLACIIMRESGLEEYQPGFRSPLYPWMQLFGLFGSIMLVGLLGWLPMLTALGLVVVGLVWYFAYVKGRAERRGALYHVMERYGKLRHDGLREELAEINREREQARLEDKTIAEEEAALRGAR